MALLDNLRLTVSPRGYGRRQWDSSTTVLHGHVNMRGGLVRLPGPCPHHQTAGRQLPSTTIGRPSITIGLPSPLSRLCSEQAALS